LEEYLHSHPCSCLYAHVITQMNGDGLNEFIQKLGQQFAGTALVLSGPASACIDCKQEDLTLLHSLDEMIAFAKEKGKPI
jgi:hypothetical protein